MQINRNKSKKNYLISQKNIPRAIIVFCLFMLALYITIFVTPSLSFALSRTYSGSLDSKYPSGGNGGQIAVFSAGDKPYGLTYGKWTAKWWQWAYSVPKEVNPAYEYTGKYCSDGQSSPVCI